MIAEIGIFLSLILLLDTGFRSANAWGVPRTAIPILILYLVYLSMVGPGMLGRLDPVNTLGLFTLLALAFTRAGWGRWAMAPASGTAPHMVPTRIGQMVALGLAAVGVVLALWPLPSWLNADTLPRSFGGMVWLWLRRLLGVKAFSFDWDTVSYHIPGLMEFLQNRTLWSFEGPYQSYSYGFELITGLSVMVGGVFSILAGNMVGLVLTVTAGTLAVRCIGANAAVRRLGRLHDVFLFLTLGTAVTLIMRAALEQIGKNDTFVAGCVVMALALLLRVLVTPADGRGRAATVLCSAAALALAMASKPNTLAYLPLWGVSAAYILWRVAPRPLPTGRLAALAVATAGVLVSGMLFTLRNLVSFGNLTGDLGFTTWGNTVVAGALQGTLASALGPMDTKVLLFLAATVMVLAVAVAMARATARLGVGLIGLWFLYGLAVFAITPFSLYEGHMVQWRLAAIPLIIGTIGIMVLMEHLLSAALARIDRHTPLAHAAVTDRNGVCRRFGGPWPVAAASVLVVLVIGIHHLVGVPQPQQTTPRQHLQIYDWVAAQPGGLRIYAAGLRPYGLLGRRGDNRLFYDLHSLPLYDEQYGEMRLNRIRREFAPDLIILAMDPHAPAPRPEKPLVPWMARQPCVSEVFATPELSVFRVERGCSAPWGSGREQPERLRMVP